VKFADGNGTVTVYGSDPYSGHNDYSCITTGAYHCCYQPYIRGFTQPQQLDGDYLRLNYRICKDRDPCGEPRSDPALWPLG
jgi:hypothetical protein